MKLILTWFAVLGVSVLLTGCATYSADTNMRSCPKMDANYPFKLYIRKINFDIRSITKAAKYQQDISLRNLQQARGRIKKELEQEYPQLFYTGKHQQSNLPVAVDIEYKTSHEGGTFLLGLNSLATLVTIGLIPTVYINSDSNFIVRIKVADITVNKNIKTKLKGYWGWFSPLCAPDGAQIRYFDYSGQNRPVDIHHFTQILKWAILQAIQTEKEKIIQEHIKRNS